LDDLPSIAAVLDSTPQPRPTAVFTTKASAGKPVRLSARFQFGDANESKTCQLAKSTRQHRKAESNSLFSASNLMLQLETGRGRHRGDDVGNEDTGADGDETEDNVKDNPDRDLTHFQAHDLAQRLNLPSGHVTEAWRNFKRYDSSNNGHLSPQEFQLLLRSLLRERYPNVIDIPRELFQKELSAEQERDRTVSFEEFLTWVSEHAFSEALLLSSEQQLLRAKARELRVSIPLVENIRDLFDGYDINRDGLLGYEEFAELFCKLMGTMPQGADARQLLPETRIRSFWMEIEGSRGGFVQFDAFLLWYLRHFDTSDPTGNGRSPLEDYYESIRPTPRVRLIPIATR